MNEKEDHIISELLTYKFLDQLKDQGELIYINALIENDPEVGRRWEELREMMDKQAAKAASQKFDEEKSDMIANVKERINSRVAELLACKFHGQLNDAQEEQYINYLIAIDPEVRKQWEELNSRMTTPQAQADSQAFDEWKVSMIANITKRRKGIFPLRSWLVAALVAGVIAGAYLWNANKPLKEGTYPANTVYLQLADGQIMPLPDSVRKAAAGKLTAHNDNGVFTFTGNYTGACTLVVPAGKHAAIKLADGTLVRLNAASTLRFNTGNSDDRTMSLNGEAYITAVPSAHRPFTVHTSKADVQVLGTEFDVNSYDSAAVKVSLVSGSVKVSTKEKIILLKPGYQVTCSATIDMEAFDSGKELMWMDDKYQFNNIPLTDIVPVLERMYGVKIQIDDPTVAQIAFSGTANRLQPITSFLDLLSKVNEATYYYEHDTIHIKQLSQPGRH
jgi:transmembrane sensor